MVGRIRNDKETKSRRCKLPCPRRGYSGGICTSKQPWPQRRATWNIDQPTVPHAPAPARLMKLYLAQ